MTSELFTKWIQAEAEILYHQHSTPERFMSRVRPLIEKLVKENKSEILSENDLEKILISSKFRESQDPNQKSSFFDVVDLCLYRAN